MVHSTWSLLDQPELATAKMSKAAGKINGAKGENAASDIWDIQYVWQMVQGEDFAEMDLRSLMENAIMKMKAATGWRSDDLEGVFFGEGLSFQWSHSTSGNSVAIRH